MGLPTSKQVSDDQIRGTGYFTPRAAGRWRWLAKRIGRRVAQSSLVVFTAFAITNMGIGLARNVRSWNGSGFMFCLTVFWSGLAIGAAALWYTFRRGARG